jgi:gliding motility-associated-like protein
MKGFFTLTGFLLALTTFCQQSTFDTDADGWTAIDSNTGSTPGYQSTGGNPGGFIQVFDGVGGTATFYVASPKFLGDKSEYYGGTLQFDLQVSVAPNSSTAGVRLTGGGLTLVKLLTPEYSLPAIAPAWSSYSFRLDESVAWRVTSTTGVVATATQIQTVLANLTELAINGEYSTVSADGGGLDNVFLRNRTEVIVYNAVSPNNDLKNEYLRIDNIDLTDNEVLIYNRWGDLVFETTNYNNDDRAFRGRDKNGNELPSGTYFYKIEFSNRPAVNGYLQIKR